MPLLYGQVHHVTVRGPLLVGCFVVGELAMAVCLTVTTCATRVELLQAYTSDNEEIYGVNEAGRSEQSSASHSDDDELGSSDSEPDTSQHEDTGGNVILKQEHTEWRGNFENTSFLF